VFAAGENHSSNKKILLLLYKSYNSTTKNINFKEFFKIIKKEDYQRVVNFLNFHSDNSESYIWISSKKDDILNPENDDSLSINPKEGVNFLRELEKEEQNEKEYLLNKKSISIAVWQRNTSIILAILTLFLVIVGFFQWNTADKLKDVSSFQSEILNKQTEISEQIAIPNKAELKIMPIQELSNRSISIGRIKDNIMDGRNESFDLWIANTGRISTSYINFLYYTNEDLEDLANQIVLRKRLDMLDLFLRK